MKMKGAVVRCEVAKPKAWSADAEIYDDHEKAANLACQGLAIPV